MTEADREDIEGIAASLTAAWNASDGTAFARSFTHDADFINIFAMHIVGREGIAKQHQTIFDGMYRGSTITFSVVKLQSIGDAAAFALIRSDLQVPQGPLVGAMRTFATAVLVHEPAGWNIRAFHNTREQPPPGPPR